MADIAQLVRALVCGTKCRRFESGYPPHHKKAPQRGVFYGVWAVRARTAGSERQLARTSFTKFAPYAVKGAHRAKANMGIYSPVIRPIFDDTPSGPCLRRGILLK